MKKLLISLLLLLACFASLCPFSFADDTTEPFSVEITENYWNKQSFLGQTLYVPYFELKITNEQNTSAKKIKVQTVVYNEEEKSVWDDISETVISSNDAPLRAGFSKSEAFASTRGYEKQISEVALPKLTVEIYVNDEYYGDFTILNTYTRQPSYSVVPKKTEEIDGEFDENIVQQLIKEALEEDVTNRLYADYTTGSLKGFVLSDFKYNYDIDYLADTGSFTCTVSGTVYIGIPYVTGFDQSYSYNYKGQVDGTDVSFKLS